MGESFAVISCKSKLHVVQADETHHRQLLLEAIWMCSCHANTPRNGCPIPIEERRLKPEAARNLALVLLELVSPDVMYNTINWPEEEFIRTTIERSVMSLTGHEQVG